jgi:spermidine/putrescine ABC transporter ATP-binding subunit
VSRIRFESVSKTFGDTTALDGFDLDVAEGEFLALLGPSGCGKTTALRLLAGFLLPTAGRILVDERDVSALPPHKRNAGMVFQDYALFPHMTVGDNIAFGLHERGQAGIAVQKRVAELLDLVRLAGMERRYPGQLSGGQQQRVALARALAFGPSVLLMDEPFGALDLKLREAMQAELVQIQRRLGITTIFVTHDQSEAMAMADRIAVMRGGRIAQLGTPEDVYDRPSNPFVAEFVGRINLFEARIAELEGDTVVLDANGVRLTATRTPWAETSMEVAVAVRPESLVLKATGEASPSAGHNCLEGTVVAGRFAGSTVTIEVETARNGLLTVEARADQRAMGKGTSVILTWPLEKTMLLRKRD